MTLNATHAPAGLRRHRAGQVSWRCGTVTSCIRSEPVLGKMRCCPISANHEVSLFAEFRVPTVLIGRGR